VSLGRIEGSVWNNLTLYDLTLTYQGVEVLQVPRLTLHYALLPLLEGRVLVTRVEGFEPIVRLQQDAQKKWNVVEAFSSDTPTPVEPATAEGGLDILLETVALQGARIDVTLSGEAERTYHLSETNLDASIGILPAGLDIQVRQLASHIITQGFPTVQLASSLAYHGTTTPATVQVSTLKLDTTHSHLRLTGAISDMSTTHTEAELVIDNLAMAEAIQLVPEWPLRQDLSGTLRINGPLADLRTQLMLAAADAQVTADVQADLSQEAPRYEGRVTIARFDAQKLLRREDVVGVVEGTVQAKGSGMALTDLNGEASLQVHALQLAQWRVGDVTVKGSLQQQNGMLSGTVRGDLGQATWQGTINLADAQPRYELTASVEHLDIKKVVAGEKPLVGDLNLTGTVKGVGFSLAEMNVQSDVRFLPSTVGPVEVKRGRVVAQVADGHIHITEMTFDAQDTTLAVQGEIGTTAEHKGRLSYTLQVGNVSPWLSLAGQNGSGALSLTGEAKGSLADLQVQGKLTANTLRVAETKIGSGTVTFDLDNIGQTQPHGSVTAVLSDIRAAVKLQMATATVTLPPNPNGSALLSAQLEAKVQDVAARTHHVKAAISYRQEQIIAHLTELSVESPDGTWQLSQPAQLIRDRDSIAVEQLRMSNRDRQLLLDGRLALSGPQNLRADIDRFPLATLQPLLPQQPQVRGRLSIQARIAGTAAAPRIDSTVNLTDLQVAGQDYVGLRAVVGYQENHANLNLTFQQDTTHALNATGTVPLAVSWAEGWNTQMLGDMDLRVRSSGLSLAFLNAFSGKAVRGVAGEFNIDVALQGPVAHPRPRGTFQLREGQALVNPLGVQISAITVAGQVDPEQVRIAQLSAKAGDGQLTGSGAIALRDYQPQHLTLSLSADRWPAIQTRQYQVEIGGELRGEGPLTAPKITGQLTVPQATLRPTLELLETTPAPRDKTIVILHAQGPAKPEEEHDLPQGAVFDNLALDLSVALPRNTWIKHHNADIELAGEVHVTKQAGDDNLVLVGLIETVRGWVGFQGRRFTLTEGQIAFTGGKEINPTLSVVAQHRFPQYVVETVVGGTAKKPSLTLRSDPDLEQADILALLLFGKPTNALGKGEKIDLQKQALQITSGYAAVKIGESVSQALGLEKLGIDLREVDFTGGRVGFGRYLDPNTYVSVSQDLAGKDGREVTVEYSLSPDWKFTTSTSATGDKSAGITWHKQY
jgi:autotransporter translocation and assembly factor TamB